MYLPASVRITQAPGQTDAPGTLLVELVGEDGIAIDSSGPLPMPLTGAVTLGGIGVACTLSDWWEGTPPKPESSKTAPAADAKPSPSVRPVAAAHQPPKR